MNTKAKKTFSIFTGFVFALLPSLSWAAIPTGHHAFCLTSEKGIELNLQKIAQMDLSLKTKALDLTKIIPLHMTATNDSQKVTALLVSHTLHNALNEDFFKETTVGNAAARINNGVSSNMAWGAEGGMAHKIDFKLKSTVAAVSYQGYVQAQLNYETLNGRLGLELSKELPGATQLVYNHSDDSHEVSDRVGLRWTW